jgi:GH25 family lysozyme M1 (1,4-beta-N-acetylmuramidase)
MRNRPEGIDVSNRNGVFDWQSWLGHIEFAMAKVTEGDNFIDPEFARNWEEMKRIKVHRFAYHYAHPDLDPATQAHFFVEEVRKQGLETGDNFVLDLEIDSGNADVIRTPEEVSFWGWVFCRTVNHLAPAHRILVYTFPFFAEQGYCAMLGDWALWIANYDVPKPTVPGPWKDAAFWQDVGSQVDRDIFMEGSEKDLEEWCNRYDKRR